MRSAADFGANALASKVMARNLGKSNMLRQTYAQLPRASKSLIQNA